MTPHSLTACAFLPTLLHLTRLPSRRSLTLGGGDGGAAAVIVPEIPAGTRGVREGPQKTDVR